MGKVTQLLAKVESTIGAVAVQWPLRRASSAIAERRWGDAWRRLASARNILARLDHVDPELRASIDEAWLTTALHLASADPSTFEETAETLGGLDLDARPPCVRDLASARAFGASLLDEQEPLAAAALGRALPWFVAASASRDYLAARLVESAARAATQARPLDGAAVLALLGEAEGLYRRVEAATSGRRAALARLRRAALLAALGGQRQRGALHDARAALGSLNPWTLAERERLAYAAIQLESARRMRRVRALDVIEHASSTPHRDDARRLLEMRLCRLGAVRDGLERDRLDGAIAAVLDDPSAAAAYLDGIGQRSDDALDDIVDPSRRRYHAALRAIRDGDDAAQVVPPTLSTPYDAGRLALVESRSPTADGVMRLWRYYRQGGRDEDLVPLARLLPVCLAAWSTLEAAHADLRELVKLYLARAPAPPYGFAALAELCVAAGEPVLAACAAERALREARDADAALDVRSGLRATQLVVDGVATLVGQGELERARALMQALASATRG